MSRKKHPPETDRDWSGHTPEFVERVDKMARLLSPAWTPEKRIRRFIWRKAYYLERELIDVCARAAARHFIEDMNAIERLSSEQADAAMRMWLEGASFDQVLTDIRRLSATPN